MTAEECEYSYREAQCQHITVESQPSLDDLLLEGDEAPPENELEPSYPDSADDITLEELLDLWRGEAEMEAAIAEAEAAVEQPQRLETTEAEPVLHEMQIVPSARRNNSPRPPEHIPVNITESQAVKWMRGLCHPSSKVLHNIMKEDLHLEWYETVDYAPIPEEQEAEIWLGAAQDVPLLRDPEQPLTKEEEENMLVVQYLAERFTVHDPYPEANLWIQFPPHRDISPISLRAFAEYAARDHPKAKLVQLDNPVILIIRQRIDESLVEVNAKVRKFVEDCKTADQGKQNDTKITGSPDETDHSESGLAQFMVNQLPTLDTPSTEEASVAQPEKKSTPQPSLKIPSIQELRTVAAERPPSQLLEEYVSAIRSTNPNWKPQFFRMDEDDDSLTDQTERPSTLTIDRKRRASTEERTESSQWRRVESPDQDSGSYLLPSPVHTTSAEEMSYTHRWIMLESGNFEAEADWYKRMLRSKESQARASTQNEAPRPQADSLEGSTPNETGYTFTWIKTKNSDSETPRKERHEQASQRHCAGLARGNLPTNDNCFRKFIQR